MILKFQLCFVIVSLILFLDFAQGGARRSNLPKPFRKYTTRRIPYGNEQLVGKVTKPRMNPIVPYQPKGKQMNYFTDQMLPPPSQKPYPPQRSMSLDDAFKMGYSAGKSIAYGDNFLTQRRPMCGGGLWGTGNGNCGSTLYNIFFPPKEVYIVQGQGPDDDYSINESSDGYSDPYVPDDSVPDWYPIAGNSYIDDGYYEEGVRDPAYDGGGIVDPGYDGGPVYPISPDTFVTSSNPLIVNVNPDGSLTPIVDSTGTILIPVKSLDSTTTILVPADNDAGKK